MAEDIFYLKKGDTDPVLEYALEPLSLILTGATVVFNMWLKEDKTVKVSRAAAVVKTATVTPTVEYYWAAGDVDTAGDYQGEFEVTFSGGRVGTFPNKKDEFISICIGEDIA